MSSYEVAHIREQGVDLIIVPLEASFNLKSQAAQQETWRYLQECAASAGLAGTVVPVWEVSGGRMASLAPPQWHAYFRSINLAFVLANINRTLTCT
jgi:hypothetical protein